MKGKVGDDLSAERGNWSFSDIHQEKFESIRIGLNDTWQKLDDFPKKLLIKHFRHFWNNARFRSSPQTYNAFVSVAKP